MDRVSILQSFRQKFNQSKYWGKKHVYITIVWVWKRIKKKRTQPQGQPPDHIYQLRPTQTAGPEKRKNPPHQNYQSSVLYIKKTPQDTEA